MKSLRTVGRYNVGLDIGTGSVGWAVTDEDGDLCRFKGKPTWGSRVFPSASTAAEARAPRGQRRRYERRRGRLNLLQRFFADEVAKVDPEFFIRLNQSRLLPADRADGHADYRWPLFNDSDFTEKDYYSRFPTIYHLRAWLMETEEKADIRLVYLALHNIVKHRGNFLHQDNPSLSAKNADMSDSVERFCAALEDWCQYAGIDDCACDPGSIASALESASLSKRDKQAAIAGSISFGVFADGKKMAKAVSQALVGYKAEFAHIFFEEGEGTKFAFSEDEKCEEFASVCPDEGLPLFEAMRSVYSSFILSGILKDADGGTISVCKGKEYERYGKDLRTLKDLVREYAPDEYDRFFRGPVYEGSARYDVSKADGYTRYNMGPSKSGSGSKKSGSYDDFKKMVEALFAGTAAVDDERYAAMMQGFDEEVFLRRLKTSDNGSIPYQLHLEEMQAIIDSQGRYYPFLAEEKDKICSLVSFRIPYYVGPLTTMNAARDGKENLRFAWSSRRDGKEDARIYPWNWEEVIDKNKSAQDFIERMTGTCTYLQGEPVLPKCSLLYEEFCVLNELNGARWTQDGDSDRRFDYADRMGIIDDVFRRGTATYKKVADWMREHRGHINVHVSGGQGESRFESRLSSYIFFCKDVFGVDELPDSVRPMVEEIILWSTLFEDRDILRDRIQDKYGDRLSEEQIKKICKKRFTGWGRLSREFLEGIKADTDNGPYSIMDVLWEGDPNSDHRSQTMVLMEILRDDRLDFQGLVDAENRKRLGKGGVTDVSDLPGSPAIRRSINQALRIVEEIAGIAGCAPEHVFIEVTRDEDLRNKGRRTKRRWDNLNEALAKLKEEAPELWDSGVAGELKQYKGVRDLDERLVLYFMQNGKSLYSQTPLDINRLSEYQVDHILPQSYIKDDSFENKALVLAGENQGKSDAMLIDFEVRRKMRPYWDALHAAGLIGDKKHRNLMRDRVTDKQMKGFIARQLVETSQVVKTVQMMLEERYPESRVLPIKASLSSQLREARGYAKCRELNDYHHAHDALLACELGRFILMRHSGMYDSPIRYAHVIRSFVKSQNDQMRRTGRMPGSAGFIVSSFLTSGFDKETGEIFKDTWDAEFETERIRRFLNFKDCFISRMPEETSEAFWDATIYSPRSGKANLSLPVKQGLDPAVYGSFSSEQFAYFFVYVVRDRKKGAESFEFASVPVRMASSLSSSSDALVEYARELADARGRDFVRIARSKVLKYQLVELDGDRLYITGKKEVRNARQFAFSQSETEVFKRIANDVPTTEEERLKLLDGIATAYERYAIRLGSQLKVAELRDRFVNADGDDQASVLMSLVRIASGATNMINLACVAGSKNAGCMNLTFSKELSRKDSTFYFIDQSVTGMFERRTKLEL